MDLTDVVPYLQRHGLLHPKWIVNGRFSVRELTRRNRNFWVEWGTATGYFLKNGMDRLGSGPLAREAAWYRFFHQAPLVNGFSVFMPGFYMYDQHADILVLEGIRHAQSLRAYYANGPCRLTPAKTLGKALAALHHIPPAGLTQQWDAAIPLSADPPWILSLYSPDLSLLREVSAANLSLLRIMQRFDEFGEALARLRQDWRTESLIHFDMKWENCLVHPAPGSHRQTRLKVIDWEFAGIGDPDWDVGSVFASFLSCWLFSLPITKHEPPARWLELAKCPLERLQPALGAFWKSYRHHQQLCPTVAHQRLLKAVRYTAARLLQTAFEHLQCIPQLTGTMVCCLQLALNLLHHPIAGAQQLFGIPLHHLTPSL